jgi:hypothetical protein
MHFAHLVRHPRVKQDALSSRSFTGINVRHDADVSRMF